MAQGIAHIDFGFIEPAMVTAIAETPKDDPVGPKGVEGHLVNRVAVDVATLERLHQQIHQALVNVRIVQKPKAKGSE